MKINDILTKIKTLAINNKNVNSSYVGDVYDIWNTNEPKYGSVVADYENSNEYFDYVDHNFVVYFGDLLNEKTSNIHKCMSVGYDVLKQLLFDLDKVDDIDVVYPCQYEPFQQQFLSNLAGGYIRFSVRTQNNFNC